MKNSAISFMNDPLVKQILCKKGIEKGIIFFDRKLL